MNQHPNSFNEAIAALRDSLVDLSSAIVESLFWSLYEFEEWRLKNMNDANFKWIALAIAAIGGFYLISQLKAPTPPAHNPAVCPDCVPSQATPLNFNGQALAACPRCVYLQDQMTQAARRFDTLERRFYGERAAVRREMYRTQLNIQQLQSRSGIAPMRPADWLTYSDLIGDGADSAKGLKWDSAPSPDPTFFEKVYESKPDHSQDWGPDDAKSSTQSKQPAAGK